MTIKLPILDMLLEPKEKPLPAEAYIDPTVLDKIDKKEQMTAINGALDAVALSGADYEFNFTQGTVVGGAEAKQYSLLKHGKLIAVFLMDCELANNVIKAMHESVADAE